MAALCHEPDSDARSKRRQRLAGLRVRVHPLHRPGRPKPDIAARRRHAEGVRQRTRQAGSGCRRRRRTLQPHARPARRPHHRARPLLAHGSDSPSPRSWPKRRRQIPATSLPIASSTVDTVVSYIVWVDVPDFRTAIAEAARVLKPGGQLVAANLSFITASPGWKRSPDGRRLFRPIDQYVDERPITLNWRGHQVVNWHRPLSAYMQAYLSGTLSSAASSNPSHPTTACATTQASKTGTASPNSPSCAGKNPSAASPRTTHRTRTRGSRPTGRRIMPTPTVRADTMARVAGGEPVYAAAERWVDAALRSDDSLFTPGQPIWSLDNLNDFHHRFAEQPYVRGQSFIQNFQRQLATAPTDTLQLAAEVLYVYYLIIWPSQVGGDTKRKRIGQVLGWTGIDLDIPEPLNTTLETGLINLGPAHARMNANIQVIAEFCQCWKEQPAEHRTNALADPWIFKNDINSIDFPFASRRRTHFSI